MVFLWCFSWLLKVIEDDGRNLFPQLCIRDGNWLLLRRKQHGHGSQIKIFGFKNNDLWNNGSTINRFL